MLDRPAVIRSSQNRTAARQLQSIRLGSGEANLLNGSRNLRADGDGCIEFAPDAGVAHGSRVRLDGWRRPLGEAKRSRPETVAPVDRRAFDAADNALRQRISPRSGDLRSRLKRQALAVRIEWSTGTNATPPPCWTGRGVIRRRCSSAVRSTNGPEPQSRITRKVVARHDPVPEHDAPEIAP